jgi:cytokinin dehydrogenase
VVVDLTRMNWVDRVDASAMTVRCQPGASLREVVAATLDIGLLPRALTNLLDLTVGGLLSVGGIGPGSHRHGALIANVASLDVVTGHGEIRSCSRTSNRNLYDAVLGGLGQCGIIVTAELELRPVRSRVRTYYLLYDAVGNWIADQRLLAKTDVVSAMEGFCAPNMQGYRGTGGRRGPFVEWFFPLQVSIEFDSDEPELPDDLTPYRILGWEDDDIRHFPARHDVRIDMIRRIGGWERAHPYIGALIEADALVDVLPTLLDILPLGDGHRGTFFVDSSDLPPLMARPDGEHTTFFAVMYPQVLPDALDKTLQASRAAADVLTTAGGKRYVADWLGHPDDFNWRQHLGAAAYERWVEAKERLDPNGIFRSALIPALG